MIVILFVVVWTLLIAAQILPWDAMAINSNNYLFVIVTVVAIFTVISLTSASLLKKYIHNIKE